MHWCTDSNPPRHHGDHSQLERPPTLMPMLFITDIPVRGASKKMCWLCIGFVSRHKFAQMRRDVEQICVFVSPLRKLGLGLGLKIHKSCDIHGVQPKYTSSYSRIAKKIWLFVKYANIIDYLAQWPCGNFFSKAIF